MRIYRHELRKIRGDEIRSWGKGGRGVGGLGGCKWRENVNRGREKRVQREAMINLLRFYSPFFFLF